MPVLLLLGGVLVLVLVSRSGGGGGGGGPTKEVVDMAGECGPYPPFSKTPDGKLWRPFCAARTPDQGPRATSALMGQPGVLYLQEGRRTEADTTNSAAALVTVVGGDAVTGYVVRVDQVQGFTMQPGVAPPPVGTYFGRVPPSFFDTLYPPVAAPTPAVPTPPPFVPPPLPGTPTSKVPGSFIDTLSKGVDPSTSGSDVVYNPYADGFIGGGAGAGARVGGGWAGSYGRRPQSYGQVRAATAANGNGNVNRR